ncbi:MAG: phosphatase PAP2 family protein, partial [Cyanobacteria bacterium J083]
MQVWLRKLADFWQQKISPQLATLVTTIGIVGLTVSWVIIVILAKLSEEVWEKEAFAFDKTILLWIHHFHSPSWNKIMLLVTQLGNPSTAVLITLLTLGILVWQRYLQEAKIFLFNCLG